METHVVAYSAFLCQINPLLALGRFLSLCKTHDTEVLLEVLIFLPER